jgi:TonB family protein
LEWGFGVLGCAHSNMATQHIKRHRGRIGRGLLLSLFLHSQVLVPLVVWVFWWNKTDDDQVDVSFESIKDEELPPNLPAIEKPERNKATKPAAKVAQAIEKTPVAKPPKPEAMTERERERERQPPAPETPKPEQKPLALPEELPRQKIVDLDMGKEVEAPKDAKYLAQRNNRTDHETRARQTNLEKNQAGKASEPSDDRDKIAQLEDREAKPGQRGQQATVPQPKSPPEPRSALSMRAPGLDKVHGEPLPEDPEGMFSKAEDGRRAAEARPMSSVAEAPHLTTEGYASTFGDDSERAAAVAKQEKSKHKGKFTERNQQVFSALENFINEVTPSNQTELNTRAAPFAQFITRMHRQIHEKWAFGFLTQMDASFRDSPMNDLNLVAKLEIVLDGEGNVDKIAMVRTSGITGFDGAAISAVFAAAPFPAPPEAILSGNGKVYIHWKFHRNGDACGTPGVNYFILDNGDKSDSKAPAAHSKHASALPTRG